MALFEAKFPLIEFHVPLIKTDLSSLTKNIDNKNNDDKNNEIVGQDYSEKPHWFNTKNLIIFGVLAVIFLSFANKNKKIED